MQWLVDSRRRFGRIRRRHPDVRRGRNFAHGVTMRISLAENAVKGPLIVKILEWASQLAVMRKLWNGLYRRVRMLGER